MRVPPFLGEGDRYKIEKEIGHGGMGSVYRAQDKNTGKRVAIKIMIDGENLDAQELFEKESAILAELQHPNIIGITDKGNFLDGGTRYPFFVMPYLKGQTLYQRIHTQGAPLSVEKVVEIISAVADSLQAAHGKGIIHRDVKPSNIFVLESGPVVVIDFGVVHLVEDSAGTTVKGTPPYMAPELLDPSKSGNPSAASDLFSLGVVCYEAVTGKHPFARSSDRETRQAILHEIPIPAFELNQNLSLVLSQVVQKSMAKDPRHRYVSVKEFSDKLERAFRSEPLPEFERQVIEDKLRVVREALSRGQATSADEMMRSIEEDGFIDPAISNQRQKIDQALLQRWIREQLDSAKLYRDANQDIAALEKLNEVLRKSPDNVEALMARDSIQDGRYGKLLDDARSLMSRHLFADARIAIQDATAIKPFDTQATGLLDELTQMETADREYGERKSALYQEAQKAQREGHPGIALRNLELLMEMTRKSPLSSPERDPIYKSLYDVLIEENNRLEKASQDVRNCLSAGDVSDAIEICERMLAANPGNSVFEALRLEAENQEQQTRMNSINRIRADLDAVQDLDARVKVLLKAVERYPNESQLAGWLKSAKAKRDFVNGLLTRARNAETPGRYSVALELWQDVKKCHPAFDGIDGEIQRVEKLRETEAREEARSRLVQDVVRLLRAGEYDKAADRSNAALSEFPADDELLAYHVEAKERALRAPEVQSLVAEGKGLLQEGSTDAAIEVLRRAVKLDPNNQQVRQLLGMAVLEKAKAAMSGGNPAEAGPLFSEAQTLIPEHPDVKNGIAQIRSKDRSETVEECLTAVLRLSESGDLNGALVRIEGALKSFPGDPRLLKEQSRIRQLLNHAPDATVLDPRASDHSSLDPLLTIGGRDGVEENLLLPPDPDSKPVLSRFSDAVVLHYENIRDRAKLLASTLVPVIQQKWADLTPYHKPILAAALIVVLSVVGVAGYVVVKNRKGPEPPKPVPPIAVALDISSFPEGAEISIDGQSGGVSKVHQELKPGKHDIVVTLAGYVTTTDSITLASDPVREVVTLVPLPMDLQIITPANAKGQVWLDNELKGDLAGATGLLISGVSSGSHNLRIVGQGKEAIETTFELSPGHAPKLTLKPPKDKATLLFIGSFGGKLWVECTCQAGGKLKVGDALQSIDPVGVEIDQPEGDPILEFTAPVKDKLPFMKSSNPGATIALYSWASSQPPISPSSNNFESFYNQAKDFDSQHEYDKALEAVEKAKKIANADQRTLLNVLESKIIRDKRIQ